MVQTAEVKEKGARSRDKYFTFLKWFWLATLITAFYGPLLAFIEYPGIFAFKILFALHLLIFVLFFVFKKIDIKVAPQIKPYITFFAIWLGWAVISLFWCDNRLAGVYNIYYLFTGLALISFTFLCFKSEKDINIVLVVLILIYLSLLAVGIWEYKTGEHLKTAGELFDKKGYPTPRGVFKNPNDFATYLVLYLPLLYVAARYCLSRFLTAPLTLILTASLGIGVFLVVNTGSRANMLALPFLAATALTIYLIQGRWKAFRNVIVVFSVFLLGYLLLVETNPQFAYWSKRQYRIAKHHLSSLQYMGGEETARKVLINNGLKELKEHAYMGVGAGNIEEHMKKYLTDDFRLLALHNWWLEILVSYGVFIFVLYLAFYFKLLHDLFLAAHKDRSGPVKLLAESTLISLVGFSIACISSSNLIFSRSMWIVFALALCAVNLYYRGLNAGQDGNA